MNSILSYPNRGPFGDANYRGNCSGYIIRDLLLYYKPKFFVEIFAGGGTGYDITRSLGFRNSIHLDLNPRFGNFNILKDKIPQGADLIFSHPPYWNIIKYSGKGNVWGENTHPDDISHINNYDEFISTLNFVNQKIYNSLNEGGRHALLIGDVRRRGKYYSIIKDMDWFGQIESHLIKIQHNTKSSNKIYSNYNFIPIAHEHLLVFRKNGLLLN